MTIRAFSGLRRSVLRSGAAVVLALPLLVGFTAHDDTFNFKGVPKAGDASDYKENVSLTISGQSVTIDTALHQVIDSVTADGGLQITQTESGTVVKVAGQVAPAPEAKPQVLSFLPDGELKEAKVDGADGNWYRLFNLSVFIHPDTAVKIGDSWTKVLPANKTTGAVPFKAVYTLVGKEKVGNWNTLKVTYKINETDTDSPASGEGTLWINADDSQLVKQETKFSNAQFPGGAGTPIDGTSTLERVK
jgi:hypothetical protein